MKDMRKGPIIFSLVFGALILSVLLVYIFISTILGSILTSTFGTKTTVNNTIISPHHLRFWGLNVLNNSNSKFPYALSVEKISVEAPLTTYFSKNIRIKEIELKNLTLVIETLPSKGNVTNWDAIIAHADSSSKDDVKSDKATTIDSLVIRKLTIIFVDPSGIASVTKINELKFSNLSTNDGDITSKIAKTIVMKLILNANMVITIPVKISKDAMNKFLQNTKFAPAINTPSKL